MGEEWLLHSLPMLIVGGIAIQAVAQRVLGGAVLLCVFAAAGDNLRSWWAYPANQEFVDSSFLARNAIATANVVAGGTIAVGVWLIVKAAFLGAALKSTE